LRSGASGKTAELALLVAGLAIGGGLTFTLSYAYNVLTPRTVTTTLTENSIVVITVPTILSTTTGTAQIEATTTTCQWGGVSEYCEVSLGNTGTLGTATTGNCTMTYGGHTLDGYTGPTRASAVTPGAAQQLIPGGSATTYCQASSGAAAGAGASITGAIQLADGGEAVFSGNATS